MSSPLLQTWLRLSDGRQHALTGSCSIGRHPTNTLPLASKEASRRHATIQAQGEAEFWIVDLGSANGTFVNGRRISQSVRLRNGDVIRIADVELEFVTEILSAMHPASKAVMASTMIRIDQAECWLMVADIEGSTRLAQSMAPEEYPRLTGTWFKECRQIIDDCGGQMSKYLGDGFFCYWKGGGDSHIRVRQAVAKLRGAQDASTLPFRVVLHHGPTVLGSVPTMSELNLHGPEVNFVFRMEKIAGKLEQRMLFSSKAVEKMQAESEVVSIGEHAVEGYSGPHSFFIPAPPSTL
ncbi:MAG: FHA domain-containing protein [Verrucomicrobiaceae bacterium]|jgi:adenylate cyclase|nr:FHA domain-containing protein [Verrucomicrobiaceae bacterium]